LKSKFTAACLAILMVATWFTVGCSMGFHAEKSTGPVTIQKRLANGDTYQLLRSNGELFVMRTDNRDSPSLEVGETFANILYFDQSDHVREFIKGEGYKPGPPPTKEQIAKQKSEEAHNGTVIWCGQGGGTVTTGTN